jgi:hypothetical protein
VKSWLRQLGEEKDIFLQGDLTAVFDNNQILRRAWNVRYDNKFHCHICTMIAFSKSAMEMSNLMYQFSLDCGTVQLAAHHI